MCGGGLGGFLISNQQEVEIGVAVDEQLRHEFRIATPNDPISIWAQELMVPLVAASTDFRNPDSIGGYKVAVIVDDEMINAFAAPGGFTYLTTGLILNSATCAEIAGVMGHEIGHVTARHSVQKLEETYAVSILAGWFLGEGLAADAINIVYNVVLNTTFSREDEAESDSIGLQIAYRAGYNPYGLVDFFEKLLELTGGGSQVPTFLSSHPATEDRIIDVAAEIEARYGNDVIEGVTQTYDCVGTQLQLADVKAHIQSGQITIIPGTGEGPPLPPPGEEEIPSAR